MPRPAVIGPLLTAVAAALAAVPAATSAKTTAKAPAPAAATAEPAAATADDGRVRAAPADSPAAAAGLVPLVAEEAALRADRRRGAPSARARWIDLVRRYADLAGAHPDAAESVEALVRAAGLSADLHRLSRAAPDLDEALRLYRAAATRDPALPLAAAACLRAATLTLELGPPAARPGGYRALAACADAYPARPEAAEARRLLGMLRALRPADAGGEAAPPPPVGPSGIPGVVIDSARLHIPAAAAPATVRDVTRVSAPSYTRVVIHLDRPAHFAAGEAAAGGGLPARLFVDVHDATLAPTVPATLPSADGLLRAARIAMFDRRTARVVLDLAAVKRFRIFPLDEPFRVVVDLFADAPPDASAAGVHPAVAGLEKALGATGAGPGDKSLAALAGLKIRRVVLDPGHGGADLGALAAGGLAEKDVNLAVALALAPLLRARLGVEVILTRETDVAVALEERTALANAARGDLLLSIHCNAAPDAAAHGVEVYYLDISSDDDALKAAARENAATTKALADLPAVLSDLVTRANADESRALAAALQKSLVARVAGAAGEPPSAVDRGVRGALFYVLLGARMPAALVETSFLSNPAEAARLGTDAYRAQLAGAIADGLAAFIAARGL
ncbi:MAG TPA: N-acetylmuramoyl-L-alanine amidase [Myxococcota bacterium]|nr:N-acetylmuramoyl-L-alanine amidase [Myxococcota bacterium]